MPNADDDVHVENASMMRMLRPRGVPDYVVLRIETRDGRNFNFGFDRDGFRHALDVFRFDLDAVDAALKSGAPDPGKPFGAIEPDRAAS